MDYSQIKSIEHSWEVIISKPESMHLFYKHLFSIAPETKHFFPDDISKQIEKLTYTLGFIVDNVGNIENIRNALYELGRYHSRLEIDPIHYEHLKMAMLKMIEEVMGDNYEESIGEAWGLALTKISSIMIHAPQKKKKSIKNLFRPFFKQ